jgi:hypothetical protein
MKSELLFFVLIIVCVAASTILLYFSFGMYHEYNCKIMESNDEATEIVISFANCDDKDYVTKKMLEDALCELDNSTSENIEAASIFSEIDGEKYDCNIQVDNHVIHRGEVSAANLENNNLIVQGRMFTKEEFDEGSLVALIPDTGTYKVDENGNIIYEELPETITVQNKSYKVIGMGGLSDTPLVPFTTLDDTTRMYDIDIGFKSILTRAQYDDIVSCFRENMGDKAEIPNLKLQDNDTLHYYRSMMLITILISVISAINFTILYCYIIEQRRRNLAIFRICGLSRSKTCLLFMGECLVLIFPAYILSALAYFKLLVPRLKHQYEYISNAYSAKITGMIFAVYAVVSVLIIFCNIYRKVSYGIVGCLFDNSR